MLHEQFLRMFFWDLIFVFFWAIQILSRYVFSLNLLEKKIILTGNTIVSPISKSIVCSFSTFIGLLLLLCKMSAQTDKWFKMGEILWAGVLYLKIQCSNAPFKAGLTNVFVLLAQPRGFGGSEGKTSLTFNVKPNA